MKVTSATVGFKRTVQPAQYESKSVELSLAIVPESEDDFLSDAEIAQALTKAKDFVYAQLGIKKNPPAVTSVKADDQTERYNPSAAKLAEAEIVKQTAEKRKPGRPVGTTTEAMAARKNPISVQAAPTQQASAPVASAPVVNDDETSFLEEPTALAKVYTDADVNKAIGLKVKELMGKGVKDVQPRIKKLINDHNPDETVVMTPNQILKSISNEARAAIMAELETLS